MFFFMLAVKNGKLLPIDFSRKIQKGIREGKIYLMVLFIYRNMQLYRMDELQLNKQQPLWARRQMAMGFLETIQINVDVFDFEGSR